MGNKLSQFLINGKGEGKGPEEWVGWDYFNYPLLYHSLQWVTESERLQLEAVEFLEQFEMTFQKTVEL